MTNCTIFLLKRALFCIYLVAVLIAGKWTVIKLSAWLLSERVWGLDVYDIISFVLFYSYYT